MFVVHICFHCVLHINVSEPDDLPNQMVTHPMPACLFLSVVCAYFERHKEIEKGKEKE